MTKESSSSRDGAEAPAALGRGERILVVEDAPMVRALFVRVLRSAGYVVSEAATGEAALAALRAMDAPVDLIVTDAIMPGLSGIELLARAHEERLAQRSLLVSGYADHGPSHGSVLPPGTSMLEKPFTPVALLRRVRALLDEAPAGGP